MLKRLKVQETFECDTDHLYDSDLKKAAAYLLEMDAKYPGASLEEHWYGYEEMELRFSRYRDETDEEYNYRVAEHDRKQAEAALRKNTEHQKELRRKQYEKLRKEFG